MIKELLVMNSLLLIVLLAVITTALLKNKPFKKDRLRIKHELKKIKEQIVN